MEDSYTLIDVFAGCGGMTAGFVSTGRFRPILAVEVDRDAATTYGVNFGHDHVRCKPTESIERFPEADVVIGGPPCQGFSTLNRRGAGLERRGLWAEYARALSDSRPMLFVMENVPQLLDSEEYQAFHEAVNRVADLGYQIEARVLDAADYGVPQRRRRAFVIGSRVGVSWPAPTHAMAATLERARWRTFGEAIEGIPPIPDGKNWHIGRNPRPESVTRYKAVPKDGGNRFEMQENLDREGLGHLVLPCFRRKPSGTTDVFGRLWWDRPAVTIRTEFYKPEKGRYLHPYEDRPITVREAARCMSFDDGFEFPTDQSMTSVGRQIGNAVPPLLARRLAEATAVALDAAREARQGIAA
ncbi:MAG: DNA cytosine methyltransferase [Gemmatimonadota bacterium]|nr:DNA cytosine methyltransferase [Gemmatimonadota bacterium]